MGGDWEITERIIEHFVKNNQNKRIATRDPIVKDIDPQKIIAINDTYSYPAILNDYKMGKLKKSVETNAWTNASPETFCLLELPDGALLVNGAGNHRAVLSKELGISSVRASVAKVEFI